MDYQLHGLYTGLINGSLVDDNFDSVKVTMISGNNSHLDFSAPYA